MKVTRWLMSAGQLEQKGQLSAYFLTGFKKEDLLLEVAMRNGCFHARTAGRVSRESSCLARRSSKAKEAACQVCTIRR